MRDSQSKRVLCVNAGKTMLKSGRANTPYQARVLQRQTNIASRLGRMRIASYASLSEPSFSLAQPFGGLMEEPGADLCLRYMLHSIPSLRFRVSGFRAVVL